MVTSNQTKTVKIQCVITGRSQVIPRDVYNKRCETCGSEQEYLRTYICKDARHMIDKGHSVDNIRSVLGGSTLPGIDPEVLKKLKSDVICAENTITTFNNKTDPAVKEYIDRL